MAEMERKYPRVGAEFLKAPKLHSVINGKYKRLYTVSVGDTITEWTGSFNEYGEKIYKNISVKTVEEKLDVPRDRVFFRGHRSAKDILKEAKSFDKEIRNDAIDYNIQTDLFQNESCEVFTTCGVDN